MNTNLLMSDSLLRFRQSLHREEKSPVTVEKYLRDARTFLTFARGREITRELVISFKTYLVPKGYAVGSVNSMLASVNNLLTFLGLDSCRAKNLRQQRSSCCPEEKELTRAQMNCKLFPHPPCFFAVPLLQLGSMLHFKKVIV